MSNTFAPYGFQESGRADGASWSANRTAYQILYSNTNTLFYGDPCVMLSTGYIDKLSPGTTPPLGIFAGCQYISLSQGRLVFSPYYPGSDQITNGIVTAFVLDDPNLIMRAQTGYSGSGSGAAAQSTVGKNAQYALGTGNTTTGLSGAYIDLTTAPTTTSTLPFRILSLVSDPPGANGTDTTSQSNDVLVVWNNHYYKQLTGI